MFFFSTFHAQYLTEIPSRANEQEQGEAVMKEGERGGPALQSEVAPLSLCVLGYELPLILA